MSKRNIANITKQIKEFEALRQRYPNNLEYLRILAQLRAEKRKLAETIGRK